MSDVPVDWRVLDVSEDEDELESFLQLGTNWNGCTKAKVPVPKPSIKVLVLLCTLKSDPSRAFSVKVRGQKITVLFEDTERLNVDEAFVYHVKLVPFVRLRNLLPYQMQFSYYNQGSSPEFINLNSGEEKILPYAVFGKTRKFC